MAGEKLYKIREVAERLDVAPNTVRNAIECGHLTAYLLPGKGRGTYRIPESAVVHYLEKHVYQAAPPPPTKLIRGRPFRHLSLD
jgi:excisionase family DNA binding protein